MALTQTAAPSISYWIITPEVDTDAVVHSIRHSWMLDAGADARFAVASGLSQSRDPSLHWLNGLNNSQVPFVAASRSDLNHRLYNTVAPSLPNKTLHGYLLEDHSSADSTPPPSQQQARVKQMVDKAWRITRQYNSFLRHKVFEIMREMCRSVRRHAFEYAFMMDADTAVNRSNLEAFVRSLPAKESVYTGFCKRRWSIGNKHVLRGVGGGPGILLSRPLLVRTCPALEHCAPLRSLMDRLERAGGDLMLAKCMEFLGVRCQMADELGHVAGDLGDLFRRGPPWVYPPLPPGTILVASKGSNGAREIFRTQREARVASQRVISYHRVKPTLAGSVWRDQRCRILAEYKRRESGPANWYSRCLPSFAVLGTPKSGTTSVFNWLLQHPDLRQPQRKELHMWAPVLQPDKACLDRSTCSVVAASVAELSETAVRNGGNQAQRQEAAPSVAHRARKDKRRLSVRVASKPAERRAVLKERPVRGPTDAADTMTAPPSTLASRRVLSAYLDFFPTIDPRDFALTGEASPAYIYSASAELFFGCKLMSHVKLLLVLRDPAERTLSEYKNKRDLMLNGGANAAQWVWGHRRFGELVAMLEPAARRCSYGELYVACEPCRRFLAAPASSRAAQSARVGPSLPRRATARASQCGVPPVVWQSWYHLFLPRWLSHGEHLLLEFSDDLFGAAPATMERVRAFLGLPPFPFDTRVAFNTESRRGAVISHTNDSRNAQAATAARHSHSEADGGKLHVVEQLVADTVLRTDTMLRDRKWKASPHQHRRAVPAAWRKRYGLGRERPL